MSPALDALRALAALAVIVLHHAGACRGLPELSTLLAYLAPLGMFGVDLFYVLSGYFILGAVLRPVRWSAREFCIHRVRRIVPAYYASIILVLVGLYGAQAAGAGFFTPALAEDLLRHASFTHNLSAASHGSLNGVYWTLGRRDVFLCGDAACCAGLARKKCADVGDWRFCRMRMALARRGVHARASRSVGTLFLGHAAPRCARYLCRRHGAGRRATPPSGGSCAHVGRVGESRADRNGHVGDRLSLFAYVLPLREQYWEVWGAAVFWRSGLAIAFGTGLLVFVLLPRQGLAERLLRISGLAYLGKISYSIYLFHVPLIFAALWAGQRVPVLGLRSVLFCVVVIGLLLIASASYTLIETPFLKNAGKLKPARVFVLAGIVCALLAGAALRWQGLDRESLWSDELFSVGIAMHAGSPDAVPQHKALADLDIPDHFWSWKQADTAPPAV
jgi:peptidoglycan/LPS O-acetylase OafA/YrhL